MARSLLDIFPRAEDLLELAPEELAGVILELKMEAREKQFVPQSITSPCFQIHHPQGKGFPPAYQERVVNAVFEALWFLINQGLVMEQPNANGWLMFTRRGATLKTRADLEAFRKASILPTELLGTDLAERVRPLFIRGDYDTAVFQAFKQVEVAVRNKAGLDAEDHGVKLMRKAFHEETGVLRDVNALTAERQAERDLFVGAIGHGKNPPSHRDVNHEPVQAARLILFAAHLLDIVERRQPVVANAQAA